MENNLVNIEKKIILFFIGISFLSLIIFWNKLPPEVPLFYSLPWGEEQLGKPLNLLLLPFSSLVFYLLTTILVKFLKPDLFLLKIAYGGVVVFSFLSFIGLFKILILVI